MSIDSNYQCYFTDIDPLPVEKVTNTNILIIKLSLSYLAIRKQGDSYRAMLAAYVLPYFRETNVTYAV